MRLYNFCRRIGQAHFTLSYMYAGTPYKVVVRGVFIIIIIIISLGTSLNVLFRKQPIVLQPQIWYKQSCVFFFISTFSCKSAQFAPWVLWKGEGGHPSSTNIEWFRSRRETSCAYEELISIYTIW